MILNIFTDKIPRLVIQLLFLIAIYLMFISYNQNNRFWLMLYFVINANSIIYKGKNGWKTAQYQQFGGGEAKRYTCFSM